MAYETTRYVKAPDIQSLVNSLADVYEFAKGYPKVNVTKKGDTYIIEAKWSRDWDYVEISRSAPGECRVYIKTNTKLDVSLNFLQKALDRCGGKY